MNDTRRGALKDAVQLVSRAAAIVERISWEESDSLDNCPDNLRATERCEKMERAVDLLSTALEKLEDAKDRILDAIG